MNARSVAPVGVRAVFVFFAAAGIARAQTLTVTPQQVYVFECQESFVVLRGTNLTGTSMTLVDFVAPGGETFELEPSTASPGELQVWIPLLVTHAEGTYSIRVVAVDVNGGTRTIGPASFLVVSRAAGAPPVLTLPEAVVADATSSSGAIVTFDAGGANCTPASGSLFPTGTNTVTCSLSNAYGTTSGTFSVVVVSASGGPPILTLPEVVVAEATAVSGAAVAFDAGGATCDRVSGSAFPMGTTTVTCSMTNGYGTSTGKFLVVVTDTVVPSLTLPGNITSGNPVVTYNATASDNIDGPLTPLCDPPSGATFPPGAAPVQCTATDAHANASTGTFTITIVPPSLSDFTASQTVYQLNAAAGGSVVYTSNVPVTLTETLTIRSEVTGLTVRTLFNGLRSPGTYQDIWNGTNDAGQPVSDGLYRYFVTVSASGSTFTWDDGARYAGTEQTQLPYPLCRNEAGALVGCADASIRFDPYANKPLRVNYCVGGGTPPSCTGTTPFVVIGKAVNVAETDETCRPDDCFVNEYQASGAHELLWYGTSVTGQFLGNATGLTVIRRNDVWPRNLTLVYGTAPSTSNLTVSWTVFSPSSTAGVDFAMTVATFQSRSVTVKCTFRNLATGSVLRTITSPAQAAGQVTVNWNGRADNGAWVAPGLYEVAITVTDSAGSVSVLKPLITVRYE